MKQDTNSKPCGSQSCVLDGVYPTDNQIYQHVYKSLKAPDWAGYNLDALFDILTAEIEGPIRLTWANFASVEKEQASMNQQIAAVLREAAADRTDLQVTFS